MVSMILKDKIERANLLLEALPYIKKFSGKTILIKYGGSLMITPKLKTLFAEDIVLLKYIGLNPIIVHGGGKEISKWMKKVGKETIFIDGLRYTDEETMELTEMILSGKINNDVVSLINQHGGKAVGLSGKDANLFTAKKIRSKTNKDLGFVGDIENVDETLIATLTGNGYIPVVSSIGVDKDNKSLNMNADHVAQCIATAVNAIKLIYLTDVQGLSIEGKLQSTLKLKKAKSLLSHKDVKEGMIPKLACALKAIESGVNSIHIINGTIEHAVILELFTDTGIGTMISK